MRTINFETWKPGACVLFDDHNTVEEFENVLERNPDITVARDYVRCVNATDYWIKSMMRS